MKPVRILSVSIVAGLFAIVPVGTAAIGAPAGASSPGMGGAGAFIVPAHANGVHGAGGPCAALGGAGALIPRTQPTTCG